MLHACSCVFFLGCQVFISSYNAGLIVTGSHLCALLFCTIISVIHRCFFYRLLFLDAKELPDSGEIRTRAPEETSALNWRLRPLGHAIMPR